MELVYDFKNETRLDVINQADYALWCLGDVV